MQLLLEKVIYKLISFVFWSSLKNKGKKITDFPIKTCPLAFVSIHLPFHKNIVCTSKREAEQMWLM